MSEDCISEAALAAGLTDFNLIPVQLHSAILARWPRFGQAAQILAQLPLVWIVQGAPFPERTSHAASQNMISVLTGCSPSSRANPLGPHQDGG